MERIRLVEKREFIGAFAGTNNFVPATKNLRSGHKRLNNGVKRIASHTFLHRYSAIMLTVVPGVLSLGETIFTLLPKSQDFRYRDFCSCSGRDLRKRGYDFWYDKRNYFVRAADAFKPMVKLSPYPSRTSMNIGMPWVG